MREGRELVVSAAACCLPLHDNTPKYHSLRSSPYSINILQEDLRIHGTIWILNMYYVFWKLRGSLFCMARVMVNNSNVYNLA